ncbi:YHS domain-containing (seleno)protein [Loktanella agnita]|uniref:YHS domain-containing (seleno)protein n=1 Tax=Loktanella agnita TaxID=287097 RepID=UPI0039870952
MTLTRRHFLTTTMAFTAVSFLAGHALADTSSIYAEDGVALGGTDVVAYFTQGQPVAGSAEITQEWQGVTWRFASADNKAAFAADPSRYAPQYGRYCAYAVSEGYTASTTPEAWRIVDDKLYLNYSIGVQQRWAQDIPGRIAAADANWPSLRE